MFMRLDAVTDTALGIVRKASRVTACGGNKYLAFKRDCYVIPNQKQDYCTSLYPGHSIF
jgi:hypothetical protein